MVGMQITFGNCDQQTPHGGAPFQSWRKGYGFGHSRGPGKGSVLNPSAPVPLRFTPSGDRGLASNPFWRGKWELGQANSFGIGDRPDLYTQEKTVGPDNYGDISHSVHKIRKTVHRPGITLKPRFPTLEEKYRDLSWPQGGPGPGKYDTSIPCGQSHWSTGSKVGGYTFGVRGNSSVEWKEAMSKPGAGDYEVRSKVGKNHPLMHGPLYDISMHGKIRIPNVGEVSPGPARYQVKGVMDKYGLLEKIQNVPGPPPGYWRKNLRGARPVGDPDGDEDENDFGTDPDTVVADPRAGGAEYEVKSLSRVESSPM